MGTNYITAHKHAECYITLYHVTEEKGKKANTRGLLLALDMHLNDNYASTYV